MYMVVVHNWDTKQFEYQTSEDSLRKVIDIADKRLDESGRVRHPLSFYLNLPNNVSTCVAPGVFVTRIENEPIPIIVSFDLKDSYDVDAIDGLRSIYRYLSMIQQYRDHIGASRPVNKDVRAEILNIIRSSQEVLHKIPILVGEYSTK
jgi:hypothetical protein